MGRLNNMIKWLVMNVNLIYAAVALVSIILAVLVMVSDWGSLDRGFFLGWCIVVILFSVLILMISLLGCMGVSHQSEQLSCWTGRRILALYQLSLLATIIGNLWMVTKLIILVRGLDATYSDLTSADDTVDYGRFEEAVADRFNEFFFSAAATCTDSKYAWFWSWVDDHCPVSIGQARCMACGDYSVTTCPADEDLCYAQSGGMDKCPYDQCRAGVLDYLISYMEPLNVALLVIAVFQLCIMVLTCMLICYTPQDTVEQMLVKTGTISEKDVDRRRRKERSNRPQGMERDMEMTNRG
ncbi:unnamed protein product [Symbiodinium microadriaticum]|nr:unnamed protein product [Symbiodinium microadriaticum]